jgi:hypothetical protein
MRILVAWGSKHGGTAGIGRVTFGGRLDPNVKGFPAAAMAIAAPLLFVAVSWLYFRPRGARDPLPTAFTFAGIVVLLDAAVVAGALQRSAAIFSSLSGFWLPIALIFLATWVTGMITSMLPFPERSIPPEPPHEAHEGARHFPASRVNLPIRRPR